MEKKFRFLVLSRAQAESVYVNETIHTPHIMVSINGTTGKDGSPADIPENDNRVDLLQICFDDVDTNRCHLAGEIAKEHKLIMFNEDHARNILCFVERNIEKVDLIVVHCFAGVCRSVAVASALSKILNNEDDKIFKSGVPNMLVYKSVLEGFWLSDYGKLYPAMNHFNFENTEHYK